MVCFAIFAATIFLKLRIIICFIYVLGGALTCLKFCYWCDFLYLRRPSPSPVNPPWYAERKSLKPGSKLSLWEERNVWIRAKGVENDVLWEGLGGGGDILLDTSADGIAEKAGYENSAAAHDEASPQLIMNMRLRIILIARNTWVGFLVLLGQQAGVEIFNAKGCHMKNS